MNGAVGVLVAGFIAV